jgi:hypothetical protein
MAQRIESHAHRIFSPKCLVKLFEGNYRIDHFSYVDGEGDLPENVELESFLSTYNGGNDGYDCG